MKVEIVENVEYDKWNELLENCKEVTVFQTQEMLDVLRKSFDNYRIYYIIASEGSKIVCGMPIIRKKRRKFSGYTSADWGTPAVLENNQVALKEVLKKFATLSNEKGISYLSVNDYFDKCGYLKDLGFKTTQRPFHVVKLEKPFESMFPKKISKSRRKNASAAIRRGVVLEEVSSIEQVREYSEMAKYTGALYGGKHSFSFFFYKNVFEIMLSKNLVKWHIARKDGTPVAATLHFVYKDVVFDFLDTSYREYQNLRANDLLVYNMMKWACENDFKIYHFGSSERVESLMRFKEIWGAEKLYFPIYIKKTLQHKIGEKVLDITRKARKIWR
jgi:lipid II:glycine glycyltransferase (peptidoglycan interpeptide bridge formation enzyme)